MNKFWNMASSLTNDKVLNIYVYGEIMTDSHWLFGSEDDVVCREFIKDLHKHAKAERINVYINSGGGEVFAAVTMAQQLKKHKAEVHTYVEGIAASAATILAMAGDVRHMTVSGLFMIHLPSMGVRGNRIDLDKGREVLVKVEDIIRMTYQDKCNLSDEELTAMLENETWLTAREAYQFGFITDIEEEPDTIDNMLKEVQNGIYDFNGVELKVTAYADPEQLQQKLAAITNKKPEGGKQMDFQAILNSLPVDKRTVVQDAFDQAVNAKITSITDELTASTGKVEELQDALTNSQEELKNVKTELQDCQEQLAKANEVTDDADTIFLNSLPETARQAILDARQQAADATKALEAVNEAAAFKAFQEKVKSYDNLPLQEEHVKSLYNLEKSAPVDFAAIEDLFKVASAAMSTGFKNVGEDGDNGEAPTDAYSMIEKEIKNKQAANPALDYNTAFEQVCAEQPDLYNAYVNRQ